nr:hypothetical protein CFP56_61471 [Quercus suber]
MCNCTCPSLTPSVRCPSGSQIPFRQTRSASHARKKIPEALDVLAIVKSRKEFSKAEWMCSSSSISGGVSG